MLMCQCAILFALMFLNLLHSLIPSVKSAPGDEDDLFDAQFLFHPSSPKYLPESLSPASNDGTSQKSSDGEGNANEMLQSSTAIIAAQSRNKRPVIDDTDVVKKAYKNSSNFLSTAYLYNVTCSSNKWSEFRDKYRARTSLEPPVQHSSGMHGQISLRDRDETIAYHSKLLEDFNNNRQPHLQLANMVELAQDQSGSRFIQKMLERKNFNEKQSVINELIQNAHLLMIDVYGTHVILKIFEYGSKEQKQHLLQAIQGNVMNLTLHKYGSGVIQAVLDSLDKHDKLKIIHELSMSSRMVKCMQDENGNHVLQKIIVRTEPQHLQFIIDALIAGAPDTIFSLSMHQYGSRIIKSVLKHCNEEQKRPIVEKLHENFDKLVAMKNKNVRLWKNCMRILTNWSVVDEYGNYVIRFVVQYGIPEDREQIGQKMRDHMLIYAQNKFASNVIEKYLIYGSAKQKTSMINEAFVNVDSQNPTFLKMIKDPFGNCVIKKMLDVADSTHIKKMMFAIKKHLPALLKSYYGKQIIREMEKYFGGENPGTSSGTAFSNALDGQSQ